MTTQAPQTRRNDWRTLVGISALGSVAAAVVFYGLVFAWAGLPAKNDFFHEAWPAYRALDHGHVLAFVRLGPPYVGSLVLRAPFALLAYALGGGSRAAYFATGLPCLITAPILGAWLTSQPRRGVGTGFFSRISPIVLCIFNPIVVIALIIGHPEEILGSVLCVAAVVLAKRGDGGWAGVLIGLAVANKAWALVAVPVVLVVLPRGHFRAICGLIAASGVILGPVLIARQGVSAGGAASTFGGDIGTMFLKPQLLWWFGRGAWIVRESHIVLVVVCAGCSALWWVLRRLRPDRLTGEMDHLLLLALVTLLRAALDPLNNLYYHLPFLFALMAYEVRRAPWLSSIYTALLIVAVPPLLIHNADLNAGAYAAVVLPTILWLCWRLYLPAIPRRGIPKRRLQRARPGAPGPPEAVPPH